MMVLCAGLFFGCDKESEKPEIPEKPPVEKPEEPEEPEQPEEPVVPPSTDDIIKTKIGDIDMIIGSNDWYDIIFENGKYVAVGGTFNSGVVAYSLDGINWGSKTITGVYDYGRNIIYGNGIYITIMGGYIAYSTDAINWNIKHISSSNNILHGIAYGNGKFVTSYISNDNKCYILTSTNGSDWVTLPASTIQSGYIYDIVYVDGLFRAMTNGGGIFESFDAITWIKPALGNDIFMNANYFV